MHYNFFYFCSYIYFKQNPMQRFRHVILEMTYNYRRYGNLKFANKIALQSFASTIHIIKLQCKTPPSTYNLYMIRFSPDIHYTCQKFLKQLFPYFLNPIVNRSYHSLSFSTTLSITVFFRYLAKKFKYYDISYILYTLNIDSIHHQFLSVLFSLSEVSDTGAQQT